MRLLDEQIGNIRIVVVVCADGQKAVMMIRVVSSEGGLQTTLFFWPTRLDEENVIPSSFSFHLPLVV